MRRAKYILLPLVVAFWTTTSYAGDEDMSPSAYHVFDPVTGYMITVDPLDEEQQVSAAADDLSPELETAVVTDQRAAPVSWRYWMAAIVLAGGIAVGLHKRRKNQNVTIG